jgi:hypothetical protein
MGICVSQIHGPLFTLLEKESWPHEAWARVEAERMFLGQARVVERLQRGLA